jgi:glycosyltransferase involved in cell wall biosynthesis
VRVVFVTHNYPRYAGDLPGAFLHPLVTALIERGHDVRVVAPADAGNGGRAQFDGVPIRRVRYGSPARETLAYEGRMQDAVRSPSGLLALRSLIRALREGARTEAEDAAGTTVVHAHWWIPGGLALPAEIPGLITLHGTDVRLLHGNLLGRWLGRRVLNRARVVTAVSQHLASVTEAVTGRRDVCSHVQPMPVDSSSRPWSRGGGGAFVVARLTRQKRVHLAIRALAELDMPLTIIGDGPERADLEALAGSLQPKGSVRFTGALPPSEVAHALGTADVLVFPAVAEGLGLAALEALIAGVPVVVCTDGGGVVSAVRAHGGGIVTDPAPGALATAVRVARTSGLRTEARKAGEQWRDALTPARVAARFDTWYRETLGG